MVSQISSEDSTQSKILMDWDAQVLQKSGIQRLQRMEAIEISQLPFALRQAALAECHDCYASLIPLPTIRTRLMLGFASIWCLTEHDIDAYMQFHKPTVTVSKRQPLSISWSSRRSCIPRHASFFRPSRTKSVQVDSLPSWM